MATVNAAPEAGKLGDDKLTAQKDEHGRYRISPTDVSQFIRLNQCRRYLRLRLHDASSNPTFMREYGVTPQAIPPLLSLSGGRFEDGVVGDMRGKFSQFVAFSRDPNIPEQHDELLAVVRQLQPGESAVGFQPKLKVNVGSSWLFSGALDILLLERDSAGVLTPLIVDVKSTDSPKVEHHLQVAYYAIMLAQLFKEHGVASNTAQQAILYRGPDGALKDPTETGVAQERDVLLLQKQRDLAQSRLGADAGFLDLLSSEDAESFVADAYDLVMREDSVAQQWPRRTSSRFPFTWSPRRRLSVQPVLHEVERGKDDLSLIPYLSSSEKSILRRHGVRTVRMSQTSRCSAEGR
ncbi:MAG: PD-(D/E)XK nuclease family protein [Chloroflexia bacterium]